MADRPDYSGLTSDIVSAFVTKNHVTGSELPALITSVYSALAATSAPDLVQPERPAPAVPLRRAVRPDAITCLSCGRKFKAIKRHLGKEHGMTPAEYREYWGLPSDSPMVAPLYSEARSGMAKALGLGQGGRVREVIQEAKSAVASGRDAAPPAQDDIAPVAPPKRRGRAPKAG